jgi:hypothetical protein
MRFGDLLPIVGLLLLSCGGGNVTSALATPPEFHPKGQVLCAIQRSHSKPLIVEWPSADRGELETHAHNRGVVVVRYVGCEMQILDRCTTPVKYAYTSMTRKRDRVLIRDVEDLYANVPIGASRLEATLAKTGELVVDMTLVGRWEAERAAVRADELQGECEGATHVVLGLSVGAFTFTAGADTQMGGGATVLGLGAHATSASRRETLNADGDEADCEKSTDDDKKPPPGCGALLRVEVVPIDGLSQANVEGNVPASPPTPAARVSPFATRVQMIALSRGSFTLGDRRDNVTLKDFWLDATEVTADAYAACVRTGQCTTDHVRESSVGGSPFEPDLLCNYAVPGRGDHPMNCVDWDQAYAYCHAQGKRLPTEEEWEWAARGGIEARLYPWGHAEAGPLLCWSGIVTRSGTCPVGANPGGDAPGGIHDLAGNVAEWTSSAFSGHTRVTRGGGWDYRELDGMRAASRHSHAPGDRADHLGFRCAR